METLGIPLEQSPKRKIIQIIPYVHSDDGEVETNLFYLCDDGTIWYKNFNTFREWIQDTDLPPGCT